MTTLANHKGFPFTHGHQTYPRRPFRPSRFVKIGEFADVVDLQSISPLAHLALTGQESVNQLVAPSSGHDGLAVGDDGFSLPFE